LLTLKSRSIIGFKYDILKERKIGKITIPYSRLWKGPYGDISIEINGAFTFIKAPLKSARGSVAAGYRLVKDDKELASVTFPARGTSEHLIVHWHNDKITFKKIAERILLYLCLKIVQRLNGENSQNNPNEESFTPFFSLGRRK